jgi:hypothetical protein
MFNSLQTHFHSKSDAAIHSRTNERYNDVPLLTPRSCSLHICKQGATTTSHSSDATSSVQSRRLSLRLRTS